MRIRDPRRRWMRGLTRAATLFATSMLAMSVWATVDSDADPAGAAPTSAGQALVVQPGGSARLNSGGQNTVFDIKLPDGAACAGDSANDGWRVSSYIVARSVDPATLTFGFDGPIPQQYGEPQATFRQPLSDSTGSTYTAAQTADATPPPGPGTILLPPLGTEGFTFAVFGEAGFEIPAGDYNMGLACVKPTGPTYPIDRFWNALLTVEYDAADVMTWSVEQPLDTTVSLAISPEGFAAEGSEVTLTTKLTPVEATGVVSFTWATTPDGPPTSMSATVADGIASVTIPSLEAGDYRFRAEFSPDDPAAYRASTAAPVGYAIVGEGDPIPTTTVLRVVPDATAAQGAGVTLTATVAPSGVAGAVVFLDGTTTIPGPIGANPTAGTYTLSTSSLALGAHSLKAVFTPTDAAAFVGSESNTVAYTITAAPAATSVSVTGTPASPATVGASVTFTATVTPSAATGTVQFKDGGVDLGAPQTVTGGVATVSTAALTTGDHSITATFIPSSAAAYSTSTSPTFPFTVGSGPAATTVTLTASPPREAEEGEEVTFTATVTPSAAAGTVVLKDGNTTIGSTATVSAGKATFKIDDLDVDEYSLTATFTPTTATAYKPSTSAALAYEITEAEEDDEDEDEDEAVATTLTLTVTPIEPQAGDRVTLTATVSPAAEGTITFSDGTAVLGSAALERAAEAAVLAVDDKLTAQAIRDSASMRIAASDELTAQATSAATATYVIESLTAGEHAFSASFTPTDPEAFAPASTASPITITAAAETTDTPLTPTDGSGGAPSISGTLPFTGGGLSIAVWGLVLLVFGRMAVLVGRKPELGDESA